MKYVLLSSGVFPVGTAYCIRPTKAECIAYLRWFVRELDPQLTYYIEVW